MIVAEAQRLINALTKEVELRRNHLYGNATNQELAERTTKLTHLDILPEGV
jgi:hypothetical protein